ncbi:augmin complex subunit dgt5 [Drosophila kikkawai]|uniref:Augmin complex subunit dgt5 n=1 Tax=Drosophila kikkawai TaxID=30033 RepID=A0A6P4IAL3_DROKI|nr:augmin complex subunit dgt5 [Drosophila kikkawai]
MAYQDKINDFKCWATSLGCPPSDLPIDDGLGRIFKSGSSLLLNQLQARIHPQEVVRELRENLLIAQVARYKDKVVPLASRSFQPPELQRYQKMQKLKEQKQKAEQHLSDARKEYQRLAASIKTKNIQTISATNRKQLLEAKCNILKLKLQSLNKSSEQEQTTKTQILATTPVVLNSRNASEKQAARDVETALKKLENFYGVCDEDTNAHTLTEAKRQLWDEMRTIFADTPNSTLLNVIMKIKEEQLQHIMHLNEARDNPTMSKPPLNSYEVKLLKTKADMLGLAAKSLAAHKELEVKEARFCQEYSDFADELQQKVHSFNGIDGDSVEAEAADELISDYLVQYNMRNFNRAQNDFLREQIEQLRQELDAGSNQLESHDLKLGSVKEVYGDINASINRIQQDMVQLSQIKDKIIFSRNMMKNLLDDMQATAQKQNAKSQLMSTKLKVSNMSMLGAESFCLANDSVFSSTKMELDVSVMNSSMRRSFDNKTLMPGGGDLTILVPQSGATVPAHLLELNTFAEMPLEKLSCLPRACSFLLSANPLIVEGQELASTVQLSPGYLLTPFGALQEVRKRILWASAIAAHMSDLKLNLEPLIVDPHDLRLKASRQQDEMDQLLDNMQAIGVKIQLQRDRAERIYRFLLDNPLRRFVPPSKRHNNGSFADYESDFNLYYRMATNGASMRD